ncbi:heme-binding domain-containing protein [Aestuariibaculum sp. YM273]|uniref:heme-binding domain-containing protein n=1 Tax=Aestuariibaculum sp. YM273 TaxID=3070659 RepID=UPI0027DB0426|nr:heme-binding domain-containing protein [Aestuariibaculum sp. YM273]WMI64570.1 heme-binding domain-containing protein [Aestuariibaculum sp. YM273]
MKLLKKMVLALLVLIVIAQFFGPEKNEGDMASIEPFLAETNPPADVKAILEETCYDCHSDVTRYPWYNNITPVNYWLAEHIEDGKKHFNVSNWVGNSVKRKDHKFEELIEMVEDKSMPLKSYTITHSEANLSEDQIKAVIDWAKLVRVKYSMMPQPE